VICFVLYDKNRNVITQLQEIGIVFRDEYKAYRYRVCIKFFVTVIDIAFRMRYLYSLFSQLYTELVSVRAKRLIAPPVVDVIRFYGNN